MKAMREYVSNQNIDFQLGLLYFTHVLAMVDGELDHHEKMAMHKIKVEEKIPDWVFDDFMESIHEKTERKIYEEGVTMLNRCREEEKLKVFVHPYKLAKADDKVHVREVRLLLYSLKATDISFEDVEFAARISITNTLHVQEPGLE